MTICYFCGIDNANAKQCPHCQQNYCPTHFDTNLHDCPLIPISNPYEMSKSAVAGGNVLATFDELAAGPVTSPIHSPVYSTESNNYNNSFYEQEEDDSETYTDGTYVWYKKPNTDIPDDAFNPESGVSIPGILWPHKSELIHILIASLLLFTLSATGFYSQFRTSGMELWDMVFAITVLSGFYLIAFLVHEFSHRQVAVHFKLQTKFRLFSKGVIMTAICLFLPIKFALPGAVVVIGLENIGRETGWCKLAGPLSNLILGSILLGLVFLPFIVYPYNFLILQGSTFNFMLGAFNMLPFGILDGDNIRKWKPKVWLIMFIVLVSMLVLNYVLLFNPSVQLILQFQGSGIPLP